METYLLFSLTGKMWTVGKMQEGLDCGLDVVGYGTGIVVEADHNLKHSVLTG